MTRHNCDICQGRGTIHLSVYQELKNVGPTVTPEAVCEIYYRDYACPECSDVTPVVRVHALKTETFVASYIEDPRFIEHAQESLALQLAGYLLRNDYVEFKQGPEDLNSLRWEMIATIGVVAKSKLDDIEARIAARQLEVANQAIEEAKFQVSNWGSHYGHSDILKSDALRLIGDAVRSVMDKRAAYKVMPKRGSK